MDKKSFWENKIQTWEIKRYGNRSEIIDGGDRSSSIAGSSLQFRFEKAAEILKPSIQGKRILDLGCGTGLFYEELVKTNFSHYTGVDLAESAIDEANSKIKGTEKEEKCTLHSGNLIGFEFADCDIVTALGVFDWLNHDEIKELFKKTYPRPFLFSISEKRVSFTRWIHSIYVFLSYGWKSEGYVPRYQTTDEILRIAESVGYKDIQIYRHKRLRFGTLLYKLD